MSTSSQSVSNALNTRKHGSLTRFLRWYLLPRMHPFRMRRRGQSGGSPCFGLCRKGARNAAHKLLYFAKSHATISDHFNNSQSRLAPQPIPRHTLNCVWNISSLPVPVRKFPNRKNQSGRTWVLLLGDTSQYDIIEVLWILGEASWDPNSCPVDTPTRDRQLVHCSLEGEEINGLQNSTA